QILPLYVKIYCCFFCLNAFAVLFFALFNIFYPVKINLLGISTEPLSLLGSIIVLVGIAKGVLAYFMHKGNVIAIKIGLIAATLHEHHKKQVRMLAYLIPRKHAPTTRGTMYFGTWIAEQGTYFHRA